MKIEPFARLQSDPLIALLPKADLHLHQEYKARLDRIAARRLGRPPYDWASRALQVLNESPPGLGRLATIYEQDAGLDLEGVSEADPEDFVTRIADVLEEGGADGAVLVEVRSGADQLLSQPDFMALFREAERRVRKRYPRLCAEAIGYVGLVHDRERLSGAERWLEACIRAAREGLAGIDFRLDPYDTEADPLLWATAYRWAERAADAGLGITVHAGEFSTANLAAALLVPGVARLGHAVYAAVDVRFLEQIVRSGSTVECCLTCNVILGAVSSYEAHPIGRFVESGIPVTLNTDLPVHVCTTIGREYTIAAGLGFSPADLLDFTRNAIAASFTSAERRTALMNELHQWETRLSAL